MNNANKKSKLPIWIIVLIAIAFGSIGSVWYLMATVKPSTAEPKSSAETVTDTTTNKAGSWETKLPDGFEYSIIKDDSEPERDKTVLRISINQKITEPQLSKLSMDIFASNERRSKTFILYFLPNLKYDSSAWATASFNPDLNVKIQGSSAQQDSVKNKWTKNFKGDVVGKWRQEAVYEQDHIIFKRNGNYFISNVMDWGIAEGRLVLKKGNMFSFPKDSAGEYFIIDSEKNLKMYNDEDKLYTIAQKIE